MLWLLLATVPALAGRWDDHPSDVIVERTIEASPEALSRAVAQFASLSELFPDRCLEDWVIGSPDVARVTYRVGPMRRRLTAKIARFDEGRLLEIDHEGKKGFVTRFRFEPQGEATRVVLGSWIQPPPAPFKGIYFKRVRPVWVDCYVATLDELAERVEGAALPAREAPAPDPEASTEVEGSEDEGPRPADEAGDEAETSG